MTAVLRVIALSCLVLAWGTAVAAEPESEPFPFVEPSNYGYTGLINMPDARIQADGVTTGGMGFSNPYAPIFATMTVLPRIELNFRYTRIIGVPTTLGPGFGDYKDKALDAKLVVLEESNWLPQLAVGTLDFHGTRLLPAHYFVASKRVGPLDLTVGYGQQRMDGLFGGLRYQPAWAPGWGLVLEHDAFDYPNDYGANQSRAQDRNGGLTPGLEYRHGVWGFRVSAEDGRPGGRVSLSIPWGESTLVSKTGESLPLFEAQSGSAALPRAEWGDDSPALRDLHLELRRQLFQNVRLALLPDGTLEARLEHRRFSHTGRAVGRAARTLLLMGPTDITGLRITYWSGSLPIATYQFTDIAALRGYFDGSVSPAAFEPSVKVTYASPEATRRIEEFQLDLSPDSVSSGDLTVQSMDMKAGVPLAFTKQTGDGSGFYLRPFRLNTLFNDPSGVLKYDLYSELNWGRSFGDETFLYASARLSLVENISDATSVLPPSNVPTVRGDYGDYLDAGPLKLDTLMLVKYWHLDERLYARASAGFYDTMFAGAGGEILWLPRRGNWAASFSLEAVRKRDYDLFALQDYSTVQAYATLHYRIPSYGITLSAMGGRFLARDEGVRLEFVRELPSGFRFGLYYTVTNADLQTYPGSPGNPYHDKGAFLSIPFGALLDRDTRSTSDHSLSPWLTDVGQSARGPSLYRHVERTLMLNHQYYNPLSYFGY
jgi:hypothetical protein